jgi:hypothetical protein
MNRSARWTDLISDLGAAPQMIGLISFKERSSAATMLDHAPT